MNVARLPSTALLLQPIGSASSFEIMERPAFPDRQWKPRFAEQNSDPDSAIQARTFDESQIFSFNGGSGPLALRLGQPVASPPALTLRQEAFNTLQKWEGYVIELRTDTFLARLTPIKGEGPDQDVEIYLSEVDAADCALIQPGAIFYWSIGYLDRPSGRIRASLIRFRRLPVWSQPDLEAAKAEAEKLRELLHDGQ